eukprot:5351110-Prymnesium_polylepis.1
MRPTRRRGRKGRRRRGRTGTGAPPSTPFYFLRLRARPHLVLVGVALLACVATWLFFHVVGGSIPALYLVVPGVVLGIGGAIFVAAFYPDLGVDCQTPRQLAHQLLVVRGCAILWSAYSTTLVIQSQFNAVAFEPPPGGGAKHPLLLALA